MRKFKELLKIAENELIDLTASPDYDPDFRLEQAEFKNEEQCWELMVSYTVKRGVMPESTIAQLATDLYPFQRIYKKVKIDKDDKLIGFYMYNE